MPCPLLICYTRDHLRTSVNAEERETQLQNIVSMGSGRAVNLSDESLNHNTIVSKPSLERNQTSEPPNSAELPLGGPFVDSSCLGTCPFDYCSVPGEGSKMSLFIKTGKMDLMSESTRMNQKTVKLTFMDRGLCNCYMNMT
ncbi:attractin-like protein 1 [Platysternon megacephalum]|uniref:Attractin-like protein 1 n=1 Tax=Platysternon megacephalum TaxID=55544 RepID=A0A4D9ETG6_9SAUR|nr:attractin-like protein 1 [Platysternon megacephalum]